MSQWGVTRYFRLDEEGGRVCVLPHVRTDGFEQATPEHLIESLHLIGVDGHVDGYGAAAAALLRDLKKRFCGQPYGNWLRADDGAAP